MALRVFTRNNDNLWIKLNIIRYVQRDMRCVNPYGPWVLKPDGRLTLLKSRMRGRAFFRMTAYPGSGMITFDLEPAPNTYMEPNIYKIYHDTLLDYFERFEGHFFLMERTAFEDRRPKLDIPPHLQPTRHNAIYRIW